MTKKNATLRKSQNKRNKGIYLTKWQIGIILTIIVSSYGLFWHFHVMVVENKDAVIEGKDAVIENKETTIGMLNTLLDNYESYNRMLFDQKKELSGIYEKRNVTSPNVTSPLPPLIPIENVSKYT